MNVIEYAAVEAADREFDQVQAQWREAGSPQVDAAALQAAKSQMAEWHKCIQADGRIRIKFAAAGASYLRLQQYVRHFNQKWEIDWYFVALLGGALGFVLGM